jgi:hypothetical protein
MAVAHPNNSICRQIFKRFQTKALSSPSPKAQAQQLIAVLKKRMGDNIPRSLLDVIRGHRQEFKNSADEMKELFDDISNGNFSERVKTDICECCIALARLSRENQDVLGEFVRGICKLSVFETWSIAMETGGSGRLFAGIGTVGATGYMSSVLQQVLRIPAFQTQVAKFDAGNSAAIREMQSILYSLMFLDRRLIDTTSFIINWREWGGQLVSSSMELDANEFLICFCDSLPSELQTLFTGQFLNILTSVNGDPIAEIRERFFSVGLPVVGAGSLEESLRQLSAPEFFDDDNQYLIPDGKLVSAKKCQKFETLPAVLVFQLRRFDFDLLFVKHAPVSCFSVGVVQQPL